MLKTKLLVKLVYLKMIKAVAMFYSLNWRNNLSELIK